MQNIPRVEIGISRRDTVDDPERPSEVGGGTEFASSFRNMRFPGAPPPMGRREGIRAGHGVARPRGWNFRNG